MFRVLLTPALLCVVLFACVTCALFVKRQMLSRCCERILQDVLRWRLSLDNQFYNWMPIKNLYRSQRESTETGIPEFIKHATRIKWYLNWSQGITKLQIEVTSWILKKNDSLGIRLCTVSAIVMQPWFLYHIGFVYTSHVPIASQWLDRVVLEVSHAFISSVSGEGH